MPFELTRIPNEFSLSKLKQQNKYKPQCVTSELK